MPRKRATSPDKKELRIDFGTVSAKQAQFLAADTTYICYGGARGGGKTHVARLKAVGLAINYPGIKILMVRAHYPELIANLIDPILAWLPNEIYSYNGTEHKLTIHVGMFIEGAEDSTIKFGHYDGRAAENEYQGVEYDIIFLEEATQLSERAFQFIGSCLRGVNDFPKRMYLTCNPGNVGHQWVKRLFIDRRFITDPKNPERTENPADYTTIRATVEDNPWLLEKNPTYVKMLASLPPDLREAHRYGDWDALSGAYFSNFRRATHTMARFKIPSRWNVYRAFDYGLDALAVGWFAVDEDGRAWCFRYYEESGLIVKDAARKILDQSPSYEKVIATYAPPDVWNRQKDTGKAMSDVFFDNGLAIIKADNNRVQGHMILKNMMSMMPLTDEYVKSLYPEGEAPATLPGIMFFDDLESTTPEGVVRSVVEDIEAIQADEKDPNDCAKEPHDVTHSVDMCRYFAIMRSRATDKKAKKKRLNPLEFLKDDDDSLGDSYEDYLCGGEITDNYMM